MSMSETWHRLSAATAEMRREPVSEKNSVAFYLSPFQIPNAWRQIRDNNTGDVTVEFRYPDEGEQTMEVRLKDGTRMKLGKASGRIFAIGIPRAVIAAMLAEVENEQSAQNRVAVGAIRQLTTNNRDNHRVTRQLFDRNMLEPATP